ncbi:Structural maintenance of chromosomes protein 5, partial [Halocaridina rubra]
MDFKHGNIARIFMQDFLTYDHVEVIPKPYLNFIIGPNGAGKSTILCAICICLGGKPETTGRARQLERYIKRGKETAVVEVEIYHKNGSNPVIRRQFSAGQNRWFLQGKCVSKKEIDSVIAKFNIQVDNLCQFLPQDRVVGFSKMNPVQLLEATEKAVGEPDLFEYHQILRESGNQMQTLKSKISEKTVLLDSLQKQNASLKAIIENVQEKEKIEREIENFQKQLKFFQYEAKRLVAKEAEEELKGIQAVLKKELEKFPPLRKEIDRLSVELKNEKVALRQEIGWSRKTKEKCNHLREQANMLFEKIQDLQSDFQSKKDEHDKRQRELLDFRRQLDVYEQQLQHQSPVNEMEVTKKIQTITRDIQVASRIAASIADQQDELISRIKDLQRDTQSHQNNIDISKDVMTRRMEVLRQKNGDAVKAAEWLKHNGNKFNAPFYMPICTLLNITDPKFANVVESVISFGDLIAFCFEDKDDMNKFKSYMDQMHIRVNIVNAVPLDLSAFNPPVPIEDLRKWGFDYFISDIVDAPPAVLSFLYRNYHIYRIPISSHERINYKNLPDRVSLFFMRNLKVSKIRSRYDRESLTEEVYVKEGTLLKITIDRRLVDRLQKAIVRMNKSISEMEEKLKSLRQEEQEVKTDLETWRNEKHVLFSRLEKQKEFMKRIEQKKGQILRYEGEMFDIKEEENEMKSKTSSTVKAMKNIVKDLKTTAISDAVDHTQQHYTLILKLQILKEMISNAQDSLSQSEVDVNSLKEKCSHQEKEKNTLQLNAKHALHAFYASLGISGKNEIPLELISKYQKSTLDKTEKLLVDLTARRDCMHTADEEEMRSYHQREEQIRLTKKELEALVKQRDRQNGQLEESRVRWLPSVQKLVNNISSNFTTFMERLECAGEVELIHDEDENDYSKYGISIKVKFRGNDRLRPLTAQRQSGGERAVSTALYMLSLQKLTSVPFRCVDEINQ